MIQNDTDGSEGKEDNSDEDQEDDKDESIKIIGLSQNKMQNEVFSGETNKRFYF